MKVAKATLRIQSLKVHTKGAKDTSVKDNVHMLDLGAQRAR